MTVKSSEEIIKRARELEMMRKFKENNKSVQVDQNLVKMVEILEMKMDMINRKLDNLLEKKDKGKIKDVHKRILDMLGGWMSTQNISDRLGYSQEYVSRMISELKEMEKVHEKREGKNLFYRKIT